MRANTEGFDYDWLVVGSGFGGSVSALRLAEKGYRVGVLEAGRRYRDADYAATTWDLKRFLWAPALGLRGIFRLTPFKDVFIASGAAVGGGSVVYANTLYRASPEFFANPQWSSLNDWSTALAPHYDTAEKMLGVVTVPRASDGQQFLQRVGEHFGVADTFRRWGLDYDAQRGDPKGHLVFAPAKYMSNRQLKDHGIDFAQAERIYEANMETLRRLGHAGWQTLWREVPE